MKREWIRYHRLLSWFAFVGVLCWTLSGISHPLMAWFSPQAKTFMPPKFRADASLLSKLEAVVDTLVISEAAVVKIVPSKGEPLLQVTENGHSPRRYFDLDTGREKLGQDEAQAKWLAAHYLKVPEDRITDVVFRDHFDGAYPRVNRLLPVYEVSFKNNNETLTAFVYTETGALAALNNGLKSSLQSFFRTLHTWSWLDIAGVGRVIIIILFMLTLFTMASTGIYLLIALPRRTIKQAKRRWHRRMAYVLWLPLLAWSASGFYHLLQAEYVEPVSGIRLHQPLTPKVFAINKNIEQQWRTSIANSMPDDAFLNGISLIQNTDGEPLYRLSIARPIKEKLGAYAQRQARFNGQALEKKSVYIHARSGKIDVLDDRAFAEALALSIYQKSGHADPYVAVSDISLVTRFGPNYDFRNKRLPVWQVDLNDSRGSRYFIDAASGILVDQNRSVDRLESMSFSILHKWNLVVPLMGREKRDILIVITLLALMTISVLGLIMRLRKA